MKRQKFLVTKEHKASFSYAMIAVEGDEVAIGKEDPEMQGWFWCKNSKGVEMWVPSTHINLNGTRGVFNQDYNSVELDVRVGDVVQYPGKTLGWVECLDSGWRYGWVPMQKLIPV
ncbi:MAG: hypothetical protein NTY03_08835 [Candidatus Bathyarchaeota archaeon]|nr:hypothetical protein [Candidatus Bathyarchaeota archaeon]